MVDILKLDIFLLSDISGFGMGAIVVAFTLITKPHMPKVTKIVVSESMNGENRPRVTNEPVEFEKTTS